MSVSFFDEEWCERLSLLEQEWNVRFEFPSPCEVRMKSSNYNAKWLHEQSSYESYQNNISDELLWDLLNQWVDVSEFEHLSLSSPLANDSSQDSDGFRFQDLHQALIFLNQQGVLLLRESRLIQRPYQILIEYHFSRCFFDIKNTQLVCFHEEEAWQECCLFDFNHHCVSHTSYELPQGLVKRQQTDAFFLNLKESEYSREEWIRFINPTPMEFLLYETLWHYYFKENPKLGDLKKRKWFTYFYLPPRFLQSLNGSNTLMDEPMLLLEEESSLNDTNISHSKTQISFQPIPLEEVLDLFYTRCYRSHGYLHADCSTFLKSPQDLLIQHQLPVTKTTIRLLLEDLSNLSFLQELLTFGFSVKEIELLTIHQKDYRQLTSLLTHPWIKQYVHSLGFKPFARMIYRHRGCPFSVFENIQTLLEELSLCLPDLLTQPQQFLNLRRNLHHLEQNVLQLFETYRHHPSLCVFETTRLQEQIPLTNGCLFSLDDWRFEIINNSHLLDCMLETYRLCLPSYKKKLHRQDVALVAIYQNNSFKGCLELDLRGDRFEIVQLKQAFNQAPNQTLKDYVQCFAQCFDLTIRRLA